MAVLKAHLKLSRPAVERLIHDGAVRCGGRMVKAGHHKLSVGDVLEIEALEELEVVPQVKKLQASQGRFEILHEDEAIVIVEKPAGMLTVPTERNENNSLVQQLERWLNRRKTARKIFCVHRLDRGVSGVLVFAKTKEVADQLRTQFNLRKPQRQYLAIVKGLVQQDRGTIDSFLATQPSLTRHSTTDGSGQRAITHFQVQQRLQSISVLSVRLQTGRRNQIRVHFAEAGHPIVGDPRYRPDEATHAAWPLKRIALHAETLGFQHPTTDEPVLFQSSWPREFGALVKADRGPRR